MADCCNRIWIWQDRLRQLQTQRFRRSNYFRILQKPDLEVEADPDLPKRRRRHRLPILTYHLQVWPNWLHDLAANDVHWVKGTATGRFKIAESLNSTNTSRVLTFTSSAGADLWWKTSVPNDQYVTWAQTGAIFANTP
jgi:hypothetical protein